MKRLICFMLLPVMLVTLCSCGTKGVTLRTDPDTVTTETKEITLLLENKSGRQIGHGYPHHLQYKVNGEWRDVEFLDPSDAGIPEPYFLTKNGSVANFSIPVEKWYGSLAPNDYRVEIHYRIGGYPFTSETTYAATVEFTVSE